MIAATGLGFRLYHGLLLKLLITLHASTAGWMFPTPYRHSGYAQKMQYRLLSPPLHLFSEKKNRVSNNIIQKFNTKYKAQPIIAHPNFLTTPTPNKYPHNPSTPVTHNCSLEDGKETSAHNSPTNCARHLNDPGTASKSRHGYSRCSNGVRSL